MNIDVGQILLDLWNSSGFASLFAGFANGGWQNLVMIIISCVSEVKISFSFCGTKLSGIIGPTRHCDSCWYNPPRSMV